MSENAEPRFSENSEFRWIVLPCVSLHMLHQLAACICRTNRVPVRIGGREVVERALEIGGIDWRPGRVNAIVRFCVRNWFVPWAEYRDWLTEEQLALLGAELLADVPEIVTFKSRAE